MNKDNNYFNLLLRLQKCLEVKYPNKQLNESFLKELYSQWRGKEKELEERVIQLENERF